MNTQANHQDAIEMLTIAKRKLSERRNNLIHAIAQVSAPDLTKELTKVTSQLNQVSAYLLRLEQATLGLKIGSESNEVCPEYKAA